MKNGKFVLPTMREKRGVPSSQVSICMYVTYPYIYNIRVPSSLPVCTGVYRTKSLYYGDFQKKVGAPRQKERFSIQKQGYPKNRGAKVFSPIILYKNHTSSKKWLYKGVGGGDYLTPL